MAKDILRIKISLPPMASNMVTRAHILGRLEESLHMATGHCRLTLIAAPAGYGKTTLARMHLRNREDSSSWYSLDERDNDRSRFWIYLISALQAHNPKIGQGTLEMVRASGLGSELAGESEAILTPVLNDLLSLDKPLYLVIDDYHLINNKQIHEDMICFIENSPPMLNLIIATRSEPPWPIVRWRARGELSEVRQRDLTFARDEVAYFLTDIKGIELTEADLETLYSKTEGWITGLQLAAFSHSNSPNADQFMNSFAASQRHVFHFLSSEVFNQQPHEIQEILLKTAILNRFCGSLCDQVTGREGSGDILAQLEQANLFVIPLDDEGIWYRYHALFADLLFHRLEASYPEEINALHSKAAQWFLEAGEVAEAVRHGLKAKDHELVAGIISNNLEKITGIEGPKLIADSLETIPATFLQKYPELIVQKAWLHLIHQGSEEARLCLELAEKIDTEENKKFLGMLTVVKAYCHIFTQKPGCALREAKSALEYLPSDEAYWRNVAAIISGDACLFSGNPKHAYDYYRQAQINHGKLDNLYLQLSSGFKVATSQYFMGQLAEAEELSRNLLHRASEKGFSKLTRAGLLWTLVGELLREKGKLAEAGHYIERGLHISKSEKPSLGWNYLFRIALFFSQGEYDDGLSTIRKIEELHRELQLPDFITSRAAAWKGRILLALGNSVQAREALDVVGINEDTRVQGGQEWGHLVLAQILLENKASTGQIHERVQHIETLAKQGNNRGIRLKALLLRARLEEQTGNRDKAGECLQEALQQGLTPGYWQVFLDEAQDLEPVLLGVRKNKGPTDKAYQDYLDSLHAALSPEENGVNGGGLPQARDKGVSETVLVEELTRRELEVLKGISEGLSNGEIGKKLFLSPGTVKWYTSNIYGKLGVKSRTEAALLAQELNLIT